MIVQVLVHNWKYVETGNVMGQKIVIHVQKIVVLVLQWNIVVIMFVIMEKTVIHVVLIVQNAPLQNHVEMGSVI